MLLLVDAVLLPGVVRRRRALEAAHAVARRSSPKPAPDHRTSRSSPRIRRSHFHSRSPTRSSAINVRAGEFVAWWSLIAVFVYYYEVIARFVFNSPTNWVHESMFLMFGMQYMLCGRLCVPRGSARARRRRLREFSPRGKAIADIITSVFFFIFIGTMLVDRLPLRCDAVNVGEHSFTEWGIQYWPVKLTMPIGAALLLLQGSRS